MPRRKLGGGSRALPRKLQSGRSKRRRMGPQAPAPGCHDVPLHKRTDGLPMRLEDTREAYETLSGRASDIVRQISLAGIGLIWIFKSGTTSLSIDPPLLKAVFFIFLSLLFDFLQYVLGTTIWFAYFRHKEKQGT